MDNNLFIMMIIIIIFFILICGINIYKHLNKDNFDTSKNEEIENENPKSINDIIIDIAVKNENSDEIPEPNYFGMEFLKQLKTSLEQVVTVENKVLQLLNFN